MTLRAAWHSPAGERLDLRAVLAARSAPASSRPVEPGWVPFESGTAALAAGLAYAATVDPDRRRVALPAYSCPSLVAAARFARLQVEFLDLAPGRLSPSAGQYEAAIASGAGIAILVDLFGAPAPVEDLRSSSKWGVGWLIHDRAQSLAAPGLGSDTTADCVIASQGRGKPVTLLGGGGAWCRDTEGFRQFCEQRFAQADWRPVATFAKGALYNLALHPMAYGLISRLPVLRLGETRLVPLAAVRRLPRSWLGAAAAQAAGIAAANEARRRRGQSLLAMALDAGYEVPADAQAAAAGPGLNRLPIVCGSPAQAARLLQAGQPLGLSPMYGRTLPEFADCTAEQAEQKYPCAFTLARRLVTLPTHSRLTSRDLAQLRELLTHGG